MKYLFWLGCIFLLSCASPRTIKDSGRVNDKGQFKAGYHSNLNLPSNTLSYLYGDAIDGVNEVIEQFEDSAQAIEYDQKVARYNKTLLAHSLDPVSLGSEFYLKYGIGWNTEVGLTYTGNAFVFDVGYQFLHKKNNGVDAALTIQYSSQDYDLPSYVGDLQKIIGYEFNRSDYLGIMRLSHPLGANEDYGHIGYGVALGHSTIDYGFSESAQILVDQAGESFDSVPQEELTYLSYGTYFNAKVGYKWVYFLVGLSVFYQEYGTLILPDGNSVYMDGFTLIPSYGLQLRF